MVGTYELRKVTDDSDTSLYHTSLADPPRYRGAPFRGFAEARPLWDVRSGRIVYLNGGELELVVLEPSGEKHSVTLPRGDLDADGLREAALQEATTVYPGLGIARAPEPAVLAIFNDLLVDGIGRVWIRRARYPGNDSAAVVRVDLATGGMEMFAVPAFPKAFLSDGSYVAVKRGPADEPWLVRVVPE
jgi:hypothetical protein